MSCHVNSTSQRGHNRRIAKVNFKILMDKLDFVKTSLDFWCILGCLFFKRVTVAVAVEGVYLYRAPDPKPPLVIQASWHHLGG